MPELLRLRRFNSTAFLNPSNNGLCLSCSQRSASWDMIFHVICMAVAWFFCAPVALLAARLRHYKSCNNWLVSKSSKNGMQIWFLLHRNCLVSASLLTLLGGITMFVATEFHFVQTHSYFGVATVVAVCVQADASLSIIAVPKGAAHVPPNDPPTFSCSTDFGRFFAAWPSPSVSQTLGVAASVTRRQHRHIGCASYKRPCES